MAKDPQDRFRSMRELATELEGCLVELGPDAEQETTMMGLALPQVQAPTSRPVRRTRRRRRSARLPLALAALVLLAAAAAGVLYALGDLGGGSKIGGETHSPGGLTQLPLKAVATLDPEGDGHEHNELIARATDGNPGTYWTTEGYDSGLGRKSGVGLILDAGEPRSAASVRVTSDTPGFTAEIRASDSRSGPFRQVAPAAEVADSHTFALHAGTTARYLVVWITELAHPNKFRAHLNEVTASG